MPRLPWSKKDNERRLGWKGWSAIVSGVIAVGAAIKKRRHNRKAADTTTSGSSES